MNWEEYWNEMPTDPGKGYLSQVGKTVNGCPISPIQLNIICDSIVRNLNLSEEDKLLDLCCGNGLVTQRIAQRCGAVLGVDWSVPLIGIAKDVHSGENISYKRISVMDLVEEDYKDIDKVLMYEGLQYFTSEQLDFILTQLGRNKVDSILFGSVPDRASIWNFYNTRERIKEYYIRKKEGTEAIGRWWDFEEIEYLASGHGFHTKLILQDYHLHTAHYRFDALLRR